MTLSEIRREWEPAAYVMPLLVVPKTVGGYTSVLVVTRQMQELYPDAGRVKRK